MSLNIKSQHLKAFIKEIQYENRNPTDTKVLDLLKDISTNPERHILKGTKLFRSRIASDQNKLNKAPDFWGYDAKESFVPPAKLTRDMRANYKYIPYLYCATDPYVSLIEVRPRLGASVSIATIIVNEDLQLLDFTIKTKPKNMTSPKENLFSDLSKLYSTPVTDEDDTFDYIPTQYIAEYAKNLGYDGIAFSSSLTPEDREYSVDRYNIVVFNFNKCSVIKSNVVTVARSYLDCEQTDDDNEHLKIKSYRMD